MRETEALVKREAGRAPRPATAPPKKDVHTRAAEEQLHLALGAPATTPRRNRGGTCETGSSPEVEPQRL